MCAYNVFMWVLYYNVFMCVSCYVAMCILIILCMYILYRFGGG